MTVTLVVAGLAAVLSLAGLLVSVLALSRSDQATSLATSANNRPLPSVAGPGADVDPHTAAAIPPGTDTAGPTIDVNPAAEYTIAYEGEQLRIQSEGCVDYSYTYVDLDEPRVVGQSGERSEIAYRYCSPGQFHPSQPFAEVSGPDATPADCLDKIRTAPGRPPIAPVTGMTLCVVTAQNSAASEGISRKIVFVTFDSISRDNDTGLINVSLRAWNMPQ